MNPIIPMTHSVQPSDIPRIRECLWGKWSKMASTVAVYFRLWPAAPTPESCTTYLDDCINKMLIGKPSNTVLLCGFEIAAGSLSCPWDTFFVEWRWKLCHTLIKFVQKKLKVRPVPVILESPATDALYFGGATLHEMEVVRAFSYVNGLNAWFDMPVIRKDCFNSTRWAQRLVNLQSNLHRGTPRWDIIAANRGTADTLYDVGSDHHKEYLLQKSMFPDHVIDRLFVGPEGMIGDQPCFDPRSDCPDVTRNLKTYLTDRTAEKNILFIDQEHLNPVADIMSGWYPPITDVDIQGGAQ